MKTVKELFLATYAHTHRAGELVSNIHGDDQEAAELLALLRAATCAAQELDNRMAGNPPAKIGD